MSELCGRLGCHRQSQTNPKVNDMTKEGRQNQKHLSRFKSQEELVVHQRLQSPVILLAILLVPLELDFPESLFVRKVALDGNMTGID
jgi:hypothetical protein